MICPICERRFDTEADYQAHVPCSVSNDAPQQFATGEGVDDQWRVDFVRDMNERLREEARARRT